MEKTGAENIDVNKEKEMVFVTGGADADLDAAIRMIEGMIVEPEVGKIYRGCVVKKVVEFGCFVEYLPGLEGLVHISELDVSRVPNVSDVTSEGAVMDVKIIAVDNRGKTSLSRKEVLLEENPELAAAGSMSDDSANERNGGGGGRGGGGRGGRGGRAGPKRDSGGPKRDSGGF
jgi:polyribonucleotide nucleotidyltransferase